MRNNSESIEYSDEPTELDLKCAELIKMFEASRFSLDDFRGRRNYDEAQIDRDQAKLNQKMAQYKLRENEMSALDQDKVLEAMLQYMGSHDQIFVQKSYAEPGTDFDDSFNGADVVFGLPRPNGQQDVIFNIDACTATSYPAVAKKFQRSDEYSKPDSPSCNRLSYFAHNNTRTRISPSPHYIIGSMPAHVSNAADKFEIGATEIRNEVDESFRRKILIELYIQSKTGNLACENIENPTDFTEKARNAHRTVIRATERALCQSFDIDIKSENAYAEMISNIQNFMRENRKNDDTFHYICHESLERLNQETAKKRARVIVKTTKNLGDKVDSIQTEPKKLA